MFSPYKISNTTCKRPLPSRPNLRFFLVDDLLVAELEEEELLSFFQRISMVTHVVLVCRATANHEVPTFTAAHHTASSRAGVTSRGINRYAAPGSQFGEQLTPASVAAAPATARRSVTIPHPLPPPRARQNYYR